MNEKKVITLRDKVAEVMPHCINATSYGGVYGCPHLSSYSFLGVNDTFDDCDREGNEILCNKCWSRPFVEKEEELKKDMVNSPSHYTNGKIECIDAIESATVNKKGIEAVCVANIIKYLWRYEDKNGIEDIKKAKWYLNQLIGHVGATNEPNRSN